jgi:hypothetical protein
MRGPVHESLCRPTITTDSRSKVTINNALARASLRTPRAAAVAGIVFSVLVLAAFSLIRVSVPADSQEAGAWLHTNSGEVALAMNLIPFAGIAFLWFMGVLRDRLGQMEDRFFATVFLGSGFLFLGTLFLTSAIVGGLLIAFIVKPDELVGSPTFRFARAVVYAMMNIYVIKMAGVFMITTSTITIYTAIAPRWLAILGYVLAVLLIFGSYFVTWSFVVFPLWVFLLSASILIDNFARGRGSEFTGRSHG